jgi:hypothetical protein
MINLEYRKGQTCKFKPILCQEGYCSECYISATNSSMTSQTYLMDNKERPLDKRRLQTVAKSLSKAIAKR